MTQYLQLTESDEVLYSIATNYKTVLYKERKNWRWEVLTKISINRTMIQITYKTVIYTFFTVLSNTYMKPHEICKIK